MTTHTGLHAAMTRLFEGQYTWGRIDVTPPAHSRCTAYRVVVYPPGTNSSERRRLTSYRNWPAAGAVLSMIALVAASPLITEPLAIGLAIVVYTGGFVVWGRLSRAVRLRCREVEASFMVESDGTVTAGDAVLLAATMRRLRELDIANRSGSITPAQFEVRWAAVYNTLDRSNLPAATDR